MDSEQLNEDDDTPKLSEHAMAALMEFYAEQNAIEKAEQNHAVTENWVIKNLKYSFYKPYNIYNINVTQ